MSKSRGKSATGFLDYYCSSARCDSITLASRGRKKDKNKEECFWFQRGEGRENMQGMLPEYWSHGNTNKRRGEHVAHFDFTMV